jgi:hypothetical protein
MEQDELKRLAAVGVRGEIARLQGVLAELEGTVPPRRGGPAVNSPQNLPSAPPRRRRNRMSPEARAKMSAMMKARWAARRKQKKA